MSPIIPILIDCASAFLIFASNYSAWKWGYHRGKAEAYGDIARRLREAANNYSPADHAAAIAQCYEKVLREHPVDLSPLKTP